MGAGLHHTAAVGFERAGPDYERGRPGYPPAAVANLTQELDLGPGKVVVDLAAGTGKLTRALTGIGAELVAVEPVAGMREQLVHSLPAVHAVEGTAERLPLADESVDAVLVAQAFHWFNVPAAAAEIHRVLRPAAGLAVIWNAWDESVDWVACLQTLTHEHVRGAPQHQTSQWPDELAETGLFADGGQATFPNVVRGGVDVLRARVASVSYISALPDDERARFLDAVADLVAADPLTRGRDEFEMPYTTTVRWYRRQA
jgi:SAM-dependent methyltransferase